MEAATLPVGSRNDCTAHFPPETPLSAETNTKTGGVKSSTGGTNLDTPGKGSFLAPSADEKVQGWLACQSRFTRPYLMGIGPAFAQNTSKSMDQMVTMRAEASDVIMNDGGSTDEFQTEFVLKHEQECEATWSEMLSKFAVKPRVNEVLNVDGTHYDHINPVNTLRWDKWKSSEIQGSSLNGKVDHADHLATGGESSKDSAIQSAVELSRDTRQSEIALSSANETNLPDQIVSNTLPDDTSTPRDSDSTDPQKEESHTRHIETNSIKAGFAGRDIAHSLSDDTTSEDNKTGSEASSSHRLGRNGRLSDPSFAKLHVGLMNERMRGGHEAYKARLDALLEGNLISPQQHSRLTSASRSQQFHNAIAASELTFEHVRLEREREQTRKAVSASFHQILRHRLLADSHEFKQSRAQQQLRQSDFDDSGKFVLRMEDADQKANEAELIQITDGFEQALEQDIFDEQLEIQIKTEEKRLEAKRIAEAEETADDKADSDNVKQDDADDEYDSELQSPLISPLPSPFLGFDVSTGQRGNMAMGRSGTTAKLQKRPKAQQLLKRVFTGPQ